MMPGKFGIRMCMPKCKDANAHYKKREMLRRNCFNMGATGDALLLGPAHACLFFTLVNCFHIKHHHVANSIPIIFLASCASQGVANFKLTPMLSSSFYPCRAEGTSQVTGSIPCGTLLWLCKQMAPRKTLSHWSGSAYSVRLIMTIKYMTRVPMPMGIRSHCRQSSGDQSWHCLRFQITKCTSLQSSRDTLVAFESALSVLSPKCQVKNGAAIMTFTMATAYAHLMHAGQRGPSWLDKAKARMMQQAMHAQQQACSACLMHACQHGSVCRHVQGKNVAASTIIMGSIAACKRCLLLCIF